jgi:hypothetical protein
MTFSTTLVTIITGIGIAAVTAWVNITIKFAPTADHAKNDAKRIFLLVLSVLSQVFLLWVLISEYLSSEPLTRHSLFVILMVSFGLFHSYLFLVYRMFIKLIFRMVVVLEKHNDLIFDKKDAK